MQKIINQPLFYYRLENIIVINYEYNNIFQSIVFLNILFKVFFIEQHLEKLNTTTNVNLSIRGPIPVPRMGYWYRAPIDRN